MTGVFIEFQFDSIDDETRFVQEYLPDAWKRFEASDFFETGWLWRFGQFATYEAGPDGGVCINVEGDPERLVEAESPHWNDFSGLSDWTVKQPAADGDSLLAQQRDKKGELAGEWQYRLKPLVTRFILEYMQAFPEPLPLLNDDVPPAKTRRPLVSGSGSLFILRCSRPDTIGMAKLTPA